MRNSLGRVRLALLVFVVGAFLPFYLISVPQSVHAVNSITVNTTDDTSVAGDGHCSLREAIANANSKSDTTSGDCSAGTGTDTILFGLGGTITLNSKLPPIANDLIIDGRGATVTIDGANSFQILVVSTGASLNLISVTLNDAHSTSADTFGEGGAINNDGILMLTNCTVSNSSAPVGGGDCSTVSTVRFRLTTVLSPATQVRPVGPFSTRTQRPSQIARFLIITALPEVASTTWVAWRLPTVPFRATPAMIPQAFTMAG